MHTVVFSRRIRSFLYPVERSISQGCVRLCDQKSSEGASESSDVSHSQNLKQKEWLQYYHRPANIKPEDTSIILFPGQGAQFVGMGKNLVQLPKVKEMFQYANEILRTDLLKTCLEGPQSKLDQTIHCQPATYVVSLAAMTKLQMDDNELIRNCVATSGFSLGEISALVFGGAMTFEEGLQIVRVRAEAMQKACEKSPGAMASVFLEHNSQLKLAILAAVNYCKTELNMPDVVCNIANYLYADCKVIAGHKQAVKFIEDHAEHFRIRRVKRLPVSGAFHTALMQSATKPLSNTISRLSNLKVPVIPVVSAVDVRPYGSVESVKRKLVLQVVRPVRWEQTLHALYIRPPDATFPVTVEPGPGRQLGAMLRMVNLKAYKNYRSIPV
ncbi:unnamed protein product [Calicophoron daubneyi]|uniref:[acyl-carrier-protein] S-malonyltransferase n=1 Tax=Calicophoron daubneyi TaxID=300641 RepID=A0AAV2TZ50_CALDB